MMSRDSLVCSSLIVNGGDSLITLLRADLASKPFSINFKQTSKALKPARTCKKDLHLKTDAYLSHH